MIDDDIPRRERRRLATPARAAILAVLIAAGGFAGGVQAQKSRQGAGAGAANAAAAPAAFAGRQRPADVTVGRVTSKRGGTLYVQTQDGTKVKVRSGSGAKIARTAAASVKGIYPGDTVVVQGPQRSSGTISATQITASAQGAGLGGGGGGPFGAAAP